MAKEKLTNYHQACPECFSLDLNVRWVGGDETVETDLPDVEVECRQCGEFWEDWLEPL